LIAFGSILVGVILLVFWMSIAGLVLFVFYEFKIRLIIENFGYIGFRETIEQHSYDFLLFGGIVMFFLILSSISFYALLVKLTWNEVHKEVKREIDKLKQISKK
jgi:hypothetical protein